MDVSSEYVKMCEKAQEIQKLWKPQEGDYVHILKHGAFLAHEAILFSGLRDALITMRGWHEDWEFEREYSIWLLRQDQLQEMYLKDMPDGTYQKIATLAEEFHDYHETNGYPIYAGSMEQLWLVFVMEKKYGKVWDGEEWQTQR